MIAAYSLCVLLLVMEMGRTVGVTLAGESVGFSLWVVAIGGVKGLGFYRYLVGPALEGND